MTILVTGGAGFIGSHLCETLVSRGERVVCIDNFNDFYDPRLKEQNVSRLVGNEQFVLYRADICDSDALRDVFEKERPDKIVHLAARAGVRPSMEQPSLYQKVNVGGTLTLLELAREFKIKQFIFGSSSSVYGSREDGPFIEEDRTDAQASVYGATKKAGELLCMVYARTYGFSVTCLRFFTVYGPRQRPDLAINKFTRLLLDDGSLPIFGDGSSARDYTHVEDIVRGIIAALDRPVDYEIINLGNNSPIKLMELVKLLEKTTGKSAHIEHLPVQTGDVPTTYASIEKAKNTLGWVPQKQMDVGLKEFFDWVQDKL